MAKGSIKEFCKRVEKESTEVLHRIQETEYRHEWSDAQFEVVGQILSSYSVLQLSGLGVGRFS